MNLYRVTNKIRTKSFGTPVFVSNKKAIGIAFSEVVDYEMQSFVIPANLIAGLLNKKQNKPQSLESLRTISNKKVGAENSKIKGLCIEKENNYKFSEQQRQAYKTVGGAPHLDGTYTVFGEVLTGMDVVDSISNVKTGKFFRPVKDIRIKRITIVK